MSEMHLGAVESRFADIIWEMEPVASGDIVSAAADKLGWKKSTTYTVLKRLGDKGIFKNDNGIVSALVSRDEFYSAQSHQFVEETFSGSLPAFIAAFSAGKALSTAEVEELKRIIARYEEGKR